VRDLGYVGEGSQAGGCQAPAATGTFYVGVLSYGSSALPDHVARRKVRWRAIYRRIIALRLERAVGQVLCVPEPKALRLISRY
jgi:hypothetical protein